MNLRKIFWKEFFTLFLILLIPNILRQVIYYIAFSKTNSIDFIASFETKVIYSTFPFVGIVEEVFIGLVFVFLWFNFSKLKFFSYGWINDAMFDYISVLSWFVFGFTPLQFLGLGQLAEFLVREIVIPYVILGPLMYKFNLNIKKVSIVYALLGIIFAVFLIFS